MARNSRDHCRLPRRAFNTLVHYQVRVLWEVLLLQLHVFPLMLRLLWWIVRWEKGQADEAPGWTVCLTWTRSRIPGSSADDGRSTVFGP